MMIPHAHMVPAVATAFAKRAAFDAERTRLDKVENDAYVALANLAIATPKTSPMDAAEAVIAGGPIPNFQTDASDRLADAKARKAILRKAESDVERQYRREVGIASADLMKSLKDDIEAHKAAIRQAVRNLLDADQRLEILEDAVTTAGYDYLAYGGRLSFLELGASQVRELLKNWLSYETPDFDERAELRRDRNSERYAKAREVSGEVERASAFHRFIRTVRGGTWG